MHRRQFIKWGNPATVRRPVSYQADQDACSLRKACQLDPEARFRKLDRPIFSLYKPSLGSRACNSFSSLPMHSQPRQQRSMLYDVANLIVSHPHSSIQDLRLQGVLICSLTKACQASGKQLVHATAPSSRTRRIGSTFPVQRAAGSWAKPLRHALWACKLVWTGQCLRDGCSCTSRVCVCVCVCVCMLHFKQQC